MRLPWAGGVALSLLICGMSSRAGEASSAGSRLIFPDSSTSPTISKIPDLVMDEDAPPEPITFRIGTSEASLEDVDLSVSSSNPLLLPTPNIVLSGGKEERKMTLIPLRDQFGESTITVRAFVDFIVQRTAALELRVRGLEASTLIELTALPPTCSPMASSDTPSPSRRQTVRNTDALGLALARKNS